MQAQNFEKFIEILVHRDKLEDNLLIFKGALSIFINQFFCIL